MSEIFDQQTDTQEPGNYLFPVINQIAVSGYLLDDPPLRKTKRGVPVTNFVIRTAPETIKNNDQITRKACDVSIVVWAQQAIQCNTNLRKGHAVLIVGELQSMPNASPNKGYLPVQINAQWIQYLEPHMSESEQDSESMDTSDYEATPS